MKLCKRCGEPGEFGKNARYPDGLQRLCRRCSAARARENYRRNPELKNKAVARKRKAIAANRERAIAFLAGRLCSGCGEVDRTLLSFVRADAVTRLNSIAKLVQSNASWSRVEEEIAKCVILCRNCREKGRGGQAKWG